MNGMLLGAMMMSSSNSDEPQKNTVGGYPLFIEITDRRNDLKQLIDIRTVTRFKEILDKKTERVYVEVSYIKEHNYYNLNIKETILEIKEMLGG